MSLLTLALTLPLALPLALTRALHAFHPIPRPTEDGQPYLHETRRRVQSSEYRVLNRAYLVPHHQSANR